MLMEEHGPPMTSTQTSVLTIVNAETKLIYEASAPPPDGAAVQPVGARRRGGIMT